MLYLPLSISLLSLIMQEELVMAQVLLHVSPFVEHVVGDSHHQRHDTLGDYFLNIRSLD